MRKLFLFMAAYDVQIYDLITIQTSEQKGRWEQVKDGHRWFILQLHTAWRKKATFVAAKLSRVPSNSSTSSYVCILRRITAHLNFEAWVKKLQLLLKPMLSQWPWVIGLYEKCLKRFILNLNAWSFEKTCGNSDHCIVYTATGVKITIFSPMEQL